MVNTGVIQARNAGVVNISGGSFTLGFPIIAFDVGVVNVFGDDLEITPAPELSGDRLTGILTDGTPIDVEARVIGGGQFNLVGPAEQAAILTEDLISTVVSLNLDKGISNSWDGKLDAAITTLDDLNDNNNVAAVNSLEALVNSIEAQRGKKIPDADADMLIDATVEIIELLNSD